MRNHPCLAGTPNNFAIVQHLTLDMTLAMYPLLEGDISWTPAVGIYVTITSGLHTLKTLIEGD